MGRRHKLNRPSKHCKECSSTLQYYQHDFCSNDCSNRYQYKTGTCTNPDALQEPKTEGELQSFYQTLEEGKKAVLTHTQFIVQTQSPTDNSPEAERKLREELSPNGVGYNSNRSEFVRFRCPHPTNSYAKNSNVF